MSLGPWYLFFLYQAFRPCIHGRQGHFQLCYTITFSTPGSLRSFWPVTQVSVSKLGILGACTRAILSCVRSTGVPLELGGPSIPGHAQNTPSTSQTITLSSPLKPLGWPPASTPRLRRRGSSTCSPSPRRALPCSLRFLHHPLGRSQHDQ